MSRIRIRVKILALVVAIASLAGILGIFLYSRLAHRPGALLMGAVIRQDDDPEKQQPLADVEITELSGLATSSSRSESTGLFRIRLREGVKHGVPIMLSFRHPEYHPLVLSAIAGDTIYVAHLTPLTQETAPKTNAPEAVISNVTVRYSAKVDTAVNVGSMVKTFTIANQADVPCNGRDLCSPDGKWKATRASTVLDAGTGNEFRNVRTSCIAGPCPFTTVDNVSVTNEGKTLTVAARAWSQTATFLVEAEVFHPMISNINRQSYPVIFGRAMNFSLPPLSEGLSIQAEVNGESIVFPLGPSLKLRWAHCTLDNEKKDNDNSQAQVYRCELKPGYRFG